MLKHTNGWEEALLDGLHFTSKQGRYDTCTSSSLSGLMAWKSLNCIGGMHRTASPQFIPLVLGASHRARLVY
jgi:hypothetical protein